MYRVPIYSSTMPKRDEASPPPRGGGLAGFGRHAGTEDADPVQPGRDRPATPGRPRGHRTGLARYLRCLGTVPQLVNYCI
jgi:hypothetical protein